MNLFFQKILTTTSGYCAYEKVLTYFSLSAFVFTSLRALACGTVIMLSPNVAKMSVTLSANKLFLCCFYDAFSDAGLLCFTEN